MITQPGIFTPVIKDITATGASYSIDWKMANKIRLNEVRLTLTQPVTALTNLNAIDGQKLVLVLIQDATGNRTVTWGTEVTFGTTGAPTLSTAANSSDYIGFIYNKLLNKYVAVAIALGF